MRRVSAFVIAACCLFASAAGADADGMRCGSRLVSSGDTLFEVNQRCGAPDFASQHTEVRTVRSWYEAPCRPGSPIMCGQFIDQTIVITVDEWSYDFGPDTLVRYLTFEQGYLLKLRTGGYGSKQT